MPLIIAVIFKKHFIADVWQCSGYASGFEYTSVLNIPGYRGSEYTRIVNMPVFWMCFWFWICQDSGYTKVLNMHETINTNSNIYSFMKYAKLYRVLIITGYARIILGYAWLCLNVPKYVWMAFVIHLPIVIPSIDCFLESKNLTLF